MFSVQSVCLQVFARGASDCEKNFSKQSYIITDKPKLSNSSRSERNNRCLCFRANLSLGSVRQSVTMANVKKEDKEEEEGAQNSFV